MNGILLVSQPILWEITSLEMREALSDKSVTPVAEIQIETREQASAALLSRDWLSAQRALDEQFQSKISPHQQSGAPLYYFGSAQIPLALYLGYLVGTWWPVRVFQQHHQTRSWGSVRHKKTLREREVDWPVERDRSVGEAIVCISTSHRVEARVVRSLVPGALLEIELGLEDPSEDAISSHEESALIAAQWKRALDLIADQFTGVHTIHLFASVQSGVAFLLGAQVSRTKHPKVQTYHFSRLEQPNHSKAILLNGRSVDPPRELTEEEHTRAAKDRAQLDTSLAAWRDAPLLAQESWLDLLSEGRDLFRGPWPYLPMLSETPVYRTSVDLSALVVEDSFSFDARHNRWQLDERWLASLAKRIPSSQDRVSLLRLLVLHESVHRGPQGLTRVNSQKIGRFSKLVEEVDYLSDVWALLHELSFSVREQRGDVRLLSLRLISLMIEGMWAFDEGAQVIDEMQVRRVNRYLIWSWQYLSIEAEPADVGLSRVAEILAQRPLLELAGPELALREEKLFFLFRALKDPEVAIYQGGKLFRHGPRNGFSIEGMIEALRHRDGVRFRECLRGAFEQTVR